MPCAKKKSLPWPILDTLSLQKNRPLNLLSGWYISVLIVGAPKKIDTFTSPEPILFMPQHCSRQTQRRCQQHLSQSIDTMAWLLGLS